MIIESESGDSVGFFISA